MAAVVLLFVMTAGTETAVDAQVIVAPDKVDELEERAYAEGQARLALEIETRDPRATIDINVYTCVSFQMCARWLDVSLTDACGLAGSRSRRTL